MTIITKIEAPGVYRRVPIESYHGQPCPGPSASASNLMDLAKRSPVKAWLKWSGNPAAERPEPSPAMVLGKAAHAMVLPGEDFSQDFRVIDASSWRTKAAQEARDEAEAEGKTPILIAEADRAAAMAEALHKSSAAVNLLIAAGETECSLFWEGPLGLWLKSRPDKMPSGAIYADYKTTCDLTPSILEDALFFDEERRRGLGYVEKAGLFLLGLRALGIDAPRSWQWVFQETEPPYQVVIRVVDPGYVKAGAERMRRYALAFATALRMDHWPGEPDGPLEMRPSRWLEDQYARETVET